MKIFKWVFFVGFNWAVLYQLVEEYQFSPEDVLELPVVLLFALLFAGNIPILLKQYLQYLSEKDFIDFKDIKITPSLFVLVGSILLSRYLLKSTFWPIAGLFFLEFGLSVYAMKQINLIKSKKEAISAKWGMASQPDLSSGAGQGKDLGKVTSTERLSATLTNEAELLSKQGRYNDAIVIARKALEVIKKEVGPEHPDVATSLNKLAMLYYAQSKYEQAESLFKKALEIRDNALGPEHPHVARNLCNLANVYFAQRKYEQAESLLKRSLAIWENTVTPEQSDMATTLNSLALVYCYNGQREEAELLFNRALVIREKVLGLEHPDVANSLIGLAALHNSRGEYDKTEPLYGRILSIREKALGMEHPKVAEILEGIIELYKNTNREKESQKLETRVAAIRAINIK